MNIKKLLSVILAIIFCFSSISIIASAEENSDYPDTSTSPACEEIKISVVYRPLKSCVSFADFGPFFDGVVLKITYSDGSSENITIEETSSSPLEYVAGDYTVYTSLFNTAEVRSPGINDKKIFLKANKNGLEYSGTCDDLSYLYIPSSAELIFMLSYAFKSVLNPIFDFYI